LAINNIPVSVSGWHSLLEPFRFYVIAFTFMPLFSFMWGRHRHNCVREMVFRFACESVVLWKLHVQQRIFDTAVQVCDCI